MALKKITDLQLISVMTDTVNIPGDDGIQTYRVTGAKIRDWLLAAGSISRSLLAATERLPISTVLPFAGGTAPTGYLLCDGSAISRTTYADLFTAIGTTYGVGDGTTTFNIPNTAGLFMKFAGYQTVSSRSFSGTLGAKGRDSTSLPATAFTSGTESAGHQHAVDTIPATSGDVTGTIGRGSGIPTRTAYTGALTANHTHTITGGGDAITQPGHIVFNALIKY